MDSFTQLCLQPGAKHLRRWVSPKIRPMVGNDKTQQRSHDDKPCFAPTITLTICAPADEFWAAVIQAVREKHAEAPR